jgi:hypothetical protein
MYTFKCTAIYTHVNMYMFIFIGRQTRVFSAETQDSTEKEEAGEDR